MIPIEIKRSETKSGEPASYRNLSSFIIPLFQGMGIPIPAGYKRILAHTKPNKLFPAIEETPWR